MTATEEPGVPDNAGVAFHPPVLLLVSLAAGFLIRSLAPLPFLPPVESATIGPAIVALSLAIFAWAVVTMLRGHTSIPTNKPSAAIMTRGPFRFSRNPIYVSMFLLHIGVGIWSNSPWFFVLAVFFVALLAWGVISREERYLERKFGDQYLSYKSRVRRWI